VARMLRGFAYRGPVYAASSAYHLPRCVMLLRLAGLDGRTCPPPPGQAARGFRKRWFWRLREAAALPFDATIAVALRVARRL
jgi:hypothetical protein